MAKRPSSRIDLSFYPLEFNLLINPDFPRLNETLNVISVVPFSYFVELGAANIVNDLLYYYFGLPKNDLRCDLKPPIKLKSQVKHL